MHFVEAAKRAIVGIILFSAVSGKAEASRVHEGVITALTPHLPAAYIPFVNAMDACSHDAGTNEMLRQYRSVIPPGSNVTIDVDFQLDPNGQFCHMTVSTLGMSFTISLSGDGRSMILHLGNGGFIIQTFVGLLPMLGMLTHQSVMMPNGQWGSGWFIIADGQMTEIFLEDPCKDMYGTLGQTYCP